jgi:hypothetical protein
MKTEAIFLDFSYFNAKRFLKKSINCIRDAAISQIREKCNPHIKDIIAIKIINLLFLQNKKVYIEKMNAINQTNCQIGFSLKISTTIFR